MKHTRDREMYCVSIVKQGSIAGSGENRTLRKEREIEAGGSPFHVGEVGAVLFPLIYTIPREHLTCEKLLENLRGNIRCKNNKFQGLKLS
jgi:hypothetical protein